MNPRPRLAAALTLAALLPTIALAQVDRHELGLRLRAFERNLAATADEPRREAAFAELDRAVQAFFRLDTAGVARALAAADAALRGGQDDAEAFAASLQLQLAHRLHDPAAAPTLAFTLTAAYPSDVPQPAALRLRLRLDGETKDRADLPVEGLPAAGELDLRDAAPGDRTLTWTLHAGDRELRVRHQGLSLATELAPRLQRLTAAVQAGKGATIHLERATSELLANQLVGMTRTRPEETVLPGARLLADAEELVAGLPTNQTYFGPDRPGQHWLRVPVGKSTTVVRLLVPPPAAGKAPLVLALHGAGGTENLFFDGYGDGAIVQECLRRGFYLVAPRGSPLGASDLPGLVDALAARWPIDRDRVLVVGHSMGAAQAVAAAGKAPARFRAVAALGGGGSLPRGGGALRLPFFVGVGTRDFALGSARGLHRALAAAGVPATLREYAGVEHLAIVQLALPDVFAFFDQALVPR